MPEQQELSSIKLLFAVIYQGLVAFIAMTYLLVFGVVLSILGLILQPLLHLQWFQRAGRWVLQLLLKWFFFGLNLSGLLKVDAKALDVLRSRKSLIIVANHPCLMDALFISSRLPNVASVMKSAVLKNPMFYGGATLAGFIRSDSPRQFVKKSQQALQAGTQLLFFPEGTRSKTSSVNEFKSGFAMLAKLADVGVQTVFIEANTPFLSKGWPLLKRPSFPLQYRLTLGKRFEPDDLIDQKQFSQAIEKYFRCKIPDYQHPPVADAKINLPD
jgi:1-acyl-sn-glycerol-3-phosphate acyltransferase